MFIYNDTCLETLAGKFIDDVLLKDNFNPALVSASSAKSGFLTGGSVIVCESKGLQQYIQKTCADKYGIWTALTFKPLAGLLMQCAYNLSKDKKDENDNVYNQHNLVWAIYRLLKGEKKTFFFARELASLFFAYQIYRHELIAAWDRGDAYTIKGADENFKKNEEFQRELWGEIKKEYNNEQNIYRLYKLIEDELKDTASVAASGGTSGVEKKFLPKQIFIFAPLSLAPVHLSTLTYLARAGSRVNLYLFQVSEEYIGETRSEKSIANLRKKSWESNKVVDENKLYWDLGNRLIANLGRSAQVLYEQLGWDNL
jgi:exonuclease V gamma subunit